MTSIAPDLSLSIQPPVTAITVVLETTGPDPLKDAIRSVAWCTPQQSPRCIELNTDADRDTLRDLLSGQHLILYDAAKCCAFLKQVGITPASFDDPKLMLNALDPTASLDLLSLSKEHLGLDIAAEPLESGILFIQSGDLRLNPPESLSLLATAIMRLHEHFRNKLDWAADIYQRELKIAPICAEMQLKGIAVSLSAIKDKISSLKLRISSIETRISNLVPALTSEQGTNWMSSRDITEVLTALGCPLRYHTQKGNISVRGDVLERLRDVHPIIPLLLELRHLVKLAGMSRTLAKFYKADTGAIHCEWLQTGVPTSRFRAKNPNLQQIPEELRSCFLARPGHYFLNLDYDQLEYRILAACAGEEDLIASFRRGEDIHRKTASLLLGIPLDEISDDQRAIGKVLGYSQLYGSGASGLAYKLNIPKRQAQKLLKDYFARVPKLTAFLTHLQDLALSHGYIENYFGRRRPLPEIYSRHPKIHAFGQRSAVNGFAQSTAADITKDAMIRLANVLPQYNAAMLVQLHDGLLLEIPDSVPPSEIVPIVKSAMESEVSGLPMTVSASWGKDWEHLH
jgi:DNA polymerase-1